MARFLISNPKDHSQNYVFHWRTKGPGKARYDPGDGEWRRFELVGDDWKEARVEVQPIPPKGLGVYQFHAIKGVAPNGDDRRLGLQLDRIELDVKR